MSRNTHDRTLDHEGTDLDTNVLLDGALSAPASTASGDTVHQALEDLNTAISGAGGGLTDLVTGNDSDFASSLGSWTNSGGTMTRDTTFQLNGFVASLKHVYSGSNQYAELPISGTFTAGKQYVAYVIVQSDVLMRLRFGVIGTDEQNNLIAINTAGNITGQFVAVAMLWTPTADRTGVVIRVGNFTSTTTARVGWVKCIQSSFVPALQNPYYIERFAPVSITGSQTHFSEGPASSDGGLIQSVQSPEVALYSRDQASGIDFLGSTTGGTLFAQGATSPGDMDGTGLRVQAGKDLLGFYISEKSTTTLQIYPDVSGGYDIELKDRGSGKFWYAVNASGNRVPLSSLMNGGMDIVLGSGTGVIPTGVAVYALELPCAGVWTSNRLLADQSGSMTVTIKKSTYSGYAGSLTSIVASAKPTLSSAIKSEDTTLTGWTTTFAAGDILRIEVDTATTVTMATLSLRFRRT